MHCNVSSFGMTLPFVLLVACGSALAADAPHPPIFVHVNNETADDAPKFNAMGHYVGFLPYLAEQHEYAKIPLRYEVIRHALTDVDLASAYRSALHCLPSPAAKEDCRDVALYQGASKAPDVQPVTTKGTTTRVDLNIDFRPAPAAMVFRFTFSEPEEARSDQIRKGFVFAYVEPVDKAHDAFPFADPADAKPSASEAVARSYWFDGHPSRFETTLRGALQDFRQFTSMYYERAGAPADDPSDAAWWKELGHISDLKNKGLVQCKGHACKWPYFRVQDGRIWVAPSFGVQYPNYESDPLSAWGGQAPATP